MQPISIVGTGLVSSVGLTAGASCAAIRAKVTNPSNTLFVDSNGDGMIAHSVDLEESWTGRIKLAKMAVRAAKECLAGVSLSDWSAIPLLLCVAESQRPGRLAGIDQELFAEIQQDLRIVFADDSLIIPHGRVSVGTALRHARRLLAETDTLFVLILATDTLITWPTLDHYEQNGRLLTPTNSNGFLPGEGAAALLIGKGPGPHLACTGLGFANETAHIDSEQPLRGKGLAQSIRAALAEAKIDMHDIDFRVADLSGEQYYFKEAALALSAVMRVRKEEMDIWHPADTIGELGSVSGLAAIVVADAACRKRYSPGPTLLFHAAADDGQRIAIVLEYRATDE